jgi:colicin import membrane protein
MEFNYKPLSLNQVSLLPYMGQSLIWHSIVALAFILLPLTLKKLNIISGEQKVVLATAAVRVDVVAMPTMTIKELRQLDQSVKVEAKGAEIKKEEAPSVVETKEEGAFLKQEEKKSFMDLVKNYKNKDLPKDKKNRGKESSKNEGKEKGKGLSNEKLNELIYMGNKISKGSALVGSTSDVSLTDLENYASLLPTHVKPYWKLPGYLMGKNIQCRIQVFLSRDGKVINTRIHTSSGDKEYDQRAVDAIIAAEPFPEVPENIAAALIQGRILLGFPL